MIRLPYPISAKIGGIYSISDSKSGRVYIGSAVSFVRRLKYHEYRFSKNTHPNQKMQNIWNKDKSRLSFSIVEVVGDMSKGSLLSAEQRHIDAVKALGGKILMNVLLVAGSHQGAKRTASTLKRLSAVNLGKKHSPEAKEKMRQAKLGRKLSDEHRQKLSAARTGRKISRPTGGANKKVRKFTDEEVREMRRLKSIGASYSEIERDFGISHGGLQKIVERKTYREVSDD